MAERVLEGQTIILDSGSTTLEVARHLTHSRLTVVTHDLRVGLEVAGKSTIHLVFIGGELLPSGLAMWGPTSVQQIDNMRVNVAIFGADTVNRRRHLLHLELRDRAQAEDALGRGRGVLRGRQP